MTMPNDFLVVTRKLVKRGWTDFEPKLISGLLTGSIAAFLVSLAGQYGMHLTAMQQSTIAVGCYFLGGYVIPSSGISVTTHEDGNGITSTVNSGSAVTTATAPTTIQPPTGIPLPTAVQPRRYDDILANISQANTHHTGDNPTQILS